MKDLDTEPIPVSLDEGHICSKQICFNPATWKVLNRLLCYDHMALAEWLPGIPKKPRRSPHGKKNQLKFQFMEGRDEDRKDPTERQGKEGSQGVPAGRADSHLGAGEEGVPVDGSEVHDEGELVGPQLDSPTDSPQDGEATGARPVPAPPAGDGKEDVEEVDPFADTEPVEESEWPAPEFGDEEDPDFKRDACRNGDFDHVWRD